jgi:hypothetical protein
LDRGVIDGGEPAELAISVTHRFGDDPPRILYFRVIPLEVEIESFIMAMF